MLPDGRYKIYARYKMLLGDPFWSAQNEIRIGRGDYLWTGNEGEIGYDFIPTLMPGKCDLEKMTLGGMYYVQRVADEKAMLIERWSYNIEEDDITIYPPSLIADGLNSGTLQDRILIEDGINYGISDNDLLEQYVPRMKALKRKEDIEETQQGEPAEVINFLKENDDDSTCR